MLLKIGLLLLLVWVLRVAGLYDGGTLVHVPLLVGLTLSLLGVLKGRDAAAAARRRLSPYPR